RIASLSRTRAVHSLIRGRRDMPQLSTTGHTTFGHYTTPRTFAHRVIPSGPWPRNADLPERVTEKSPFHVRAGRERGSMVCSTQRLRGNGGACARTHSSVRAHAPHDQRYSARLLGGGAARGSREHLLPACAL